MKVFLYAVLTLSLDGGMSQPLLAWGRNPWYPVSVRLGGQQISSGHFGEQKIMFISQSTCNVGIILTCLSCIPIM